MEFVRNEIEARRARTYFSRRVKHGIQFNHTWMGDFMQNVHFSMDLVLLLAESRLIDHLDGHMLVGFQAVT